MPLRDLTSDERSTIKQCLDAVASGKIILDDWEFPVLFGIEFADLQAVANAWPDVDDSDDCTFAAINGSLNNLLGYPHGKMARWSTYISSPPSEVSRILSKWRGQVIGNYFEGAAIERFADDQE